MTDRMPRPPGMARAGYIKMQVPAAGGSAFALVPGVMIRVWPLDPRPGAVVRPVAAEALLDTGAARSMVPLWSLQELGVEPREESRRTVYGAGGDFEAFSVGVRMEFEHGGSWVDIGAVDVLVPDTPRSADPSFRLPFLIGRSDFFSKFDMYMSESRKSVWLGRTDYGQAGEAKGR